MVNMVLETIKKRRSIINFLAKPVNDELLNVVLEAGRWAPSWLNQQPWKFIVVSEKETKRKASAMVPTVFSSTLKDAPMFIGVCVNPELDPYHFIEDGAAATQNMTLVAHSLGLGTCWIGAFSLGDERDSAERKLKKLLRIPKNWRLLSLIPLGYPKFKGKKNRRKLVDIVDSNYFIDREKKLSTEKVVVQKTPVKKILTPTSTPPV
jgi:nitroreductase